MKQAENSLKCKALLMKITKTLSFFFLFRFRMLLAHLRRRLIGELIVYEGIRRPSLVRPSVVRLSTFSNDISSEAVRPILFIFHI